MSSIKKIIDEGTESIVTLVQLDNGTSVIRKTRQPQGVTDYMFEAFAYTSVGRRGSNVPSVIDASEESLTMSMLAGKTLDDQPNLYNDTKIFDDIAKDLSINRKVVFKGYGRPTLEEGVYIGEYASWSDFLNNTYSKLDHSSLLPETLKKLLKSKWNEMVSHIKLEKGALVHGDFAMSAIFVNKNKYEGIIDYGDAFIGDPLLDLAYFRFKEINKEYGYKIYDLLANSYSRHSGVDREYIDTATLFNMMYWAVERVHTENLESEIIGKFIEKTRVLAQLL